MLSRNQIPEQTVVGEPGRDQHGRVGRQVCYRPRVGALQPYRVAVHGHQGLAGFQLHSGAQKPRLDAVDLESVPRPYRNLRLGAHDRDIEAFFGEQFGQHARHVVVVVIEDHDAGSARAHSSECVIGGEHMSTLGDRDGLLMPAAHTVGAPTCAGGHHHVGETEFQNVVDGDRALPVDLDVVETGQLVLPVVDDTYP